MKTVKLTSILFAFCLLALNANGDSRTWTDASTNRTIEGEFLRAEGANVVIRLANGQSVDVALERLSDADQAFIEEQSAKLTEPAGGSFTRIIPPVSSKALSVTGKGDNREAGLEVTNNSDKGISKLRVKMFLYGEDGTIEKSVPHTSDGRFGEKEEFKNGASYVIKLSNFWIKDDIAAVSGVVQGLVWEDGTEWPVWSGPTPEQEGNIPVSLVMKGVLGEGDTKLPLIECFNHSGKGIKSIQYRVHFFDGEGNELLKKRWGTSNQNGLVDAGKGIAVVGAGPPPMGSITVKLSLTEVTFEDDSEWEPTS